jgi:hypothetical protein
MPMNTTCHVTVITTVEPITNPTTTLAYDDAPMTWIFYVCAGMFYKLEFIPVFD